MNIHKHQNSPRMHDIKKCTGSDMKPPQHWISLKEGGINIGETEISDVSDKEFKIL